MPNENETTTTPPKPDSGFGAMLKNPLTWILALGGGALGFGFGGSIMWALLGAVIPAGIYMATQADKADTKKQEETAAATAAAAEERKKKVAALAKARTDADALNAELTGLETSLNAAQFDTVERPEHSEEAKANLKRQAEATLQQVKEKEAAAEAAVKKAAEDLKAANEAKDPELVTFAQAAQAAANSAATRLAALKTSAFTILAKDNLPGMIEAQTKALAEANKTLEGFDTKLKAAKEQAEGADAEKKKQARIEAENLKLAAEEAQQKQKKVAEEAKKLLALKDVATEEQRKTLSELQAAAATAAVETEKKVKAVKALIDTLPAANDAAVRTLKLASTGSIAVTNWKYVDDNAQKAGLQGLKRELKVALDYNGQRRTGYFVGEFKTGGNFVPSHFIFTDGYGDYDGGKNATFIELTPEMSKALAVTADNKVNLNDATTKNNINAMLDKIAAHMQGNDIRVHVASIPPKNGEIRVLGGTGITSKNETQRTLIRSFKRSESVNPLSRDQKPNEMPLQSNLGVVQFDVDNHGYVTDWAYFVVPDSRENGKWLDGMASFETQRFNEGGKHMLHVRKVRILSEDGKREIVVPLDGADTLKLEYTDPDTDKTLSLTKENRAAIASAVQRALAKKPELMEELKPLPANSLQALESLNKFQDISVPEFREIRPKSPAGTILQTHDGIELNTRGVNDGKLSLKITGKVENHKYSQPLVTITYTGTDGVDRVITHRSSKTLTLTETHGLEFTPRTEAELKAIATEALQSVAPPPMRSRKEIQTPGVTIGHLDGTRMPEDDFERLLRKAKSVPLGGFVPLQPDSGEGGPGLTA